MNRLLALLELDFVLPGRLQDLTQLLATHVARHLRASVHGMKLYQASDGPGAKHGACGVRMELRFGRAVY